MVVKLVRLWHMPVDIKVAGRSRKLNLEALHRRRQHNLAAEPGRWRQLKGQVQHILLVVRQWSQILNLVVCVVFKDQMARATRTYAFASAFELNVMLLREAQQVLALSADN